MPKTSRRVRVALGEELRAVGELAFESDGRRETSMFRYAAEWLADPRGFAIAPGLPRSEAPYFASGSSLDRRSALPGAFGDGAPDAWGRGLIRRALSGPLGELDYLLAVDDPTRQGALRYLDSDGTPLARSGPPAAGAGALGKLRRLVRLVGTGQEVSLPDRERLLRSASSLGGARPKATLLDDEGNLVVAKFTGENDTRPIERVEVATLQLARSAGLAAAEARLVLGNTVSPVALIKRFDRAGAGRIHYLSAQSFLGAEHGATAFYTDIADALRAHAESPREQLHELYRRILFTILVSNNDDHLKNHGLLHAGSGRWVLSPAFDINPEPHRDRRLKTGISELSGNEASVEAALEAAPFFELKPDDAAATAARMASTIRNEWRGRLAASGLTVAEIGAYRPAFEHGESRLALRLGRKEPSAG